MSPAMNGRVEKFAHFNTCGSPALSYAPHISWHWSYVFLAQTHRYDIFTYIHTCTYVCMHTHNHRHSIFQGQNYSSEKFLSRRLVASYWPTSNRPAVACMVIICGESENFDLNFYMPGLAFISVFDNLWNNFSTRLDSDWALCHLKNSHEQNSMETYSK